MGVLSCQLGLNVEDALAKDGEIVEGVSGAAIHSKVSSHIAWEPTFEMHVGAVLVDAVFAKLTEECLELGVVLQDSVGPKRD